MLDSQKVFFVGPSSAMKAQAGKEREAPPRGRAFDVAPRAMFGNYSIGNSYNYSYWQLI